MSAECGFLHGAFKRIGLWSVYMGAGRTKAEDV
jgi:hypothetical protein